MENRIQNIGYELYIVVYVKLMPYNQVAQLHVHHYTKFILNNNNLHGNSIHDYPMATTEVLCFKL